ncbi:hypothetical protein [Robiginitomaculum antarcticum]|uniref:hypothetical protein n=1 Tax=Robiginitomaculum antarcticum TaxID=437507 RepID=UPI0003A2D1D9|nr:hypothetical protein [Robiginitomaculum antarcticum]
MIKTETGLGALSAIVISLAAAFVIAAPASATPNCASPEGCTSWTSVGTNYGTSYSNQRAAPPVTTYNSYPAQRFALSSQNSYQNVSAPSANMVRVPCPYTVDVPTGGRVLDCYAISRPRKVVRQYQRAYQVVRPIIYVHYPVLVPPPVYCGAPVYNGCR